MKITVILCTYNRCQSLRTALDSVASSAFPNSTDWEVLVVDNNSTDATSDVVKDFCHRSPQHFRYLFEPKQGKSNALNAGVRNTNAYIVAFMDDDVTVDPDWLCNLTKVLDSSEWAGAGGRILPNWMCAQPPWLWFDGPHPLAPFAVFDLGTDGHALAEPPFGTNMAFRREVFQKYGGFREDMGPCPGSQRQNEDTEFGRRLMAAGERLWYEPSAVVHHPVTEARVQKKYLLKWWFDKARADIQEFGIPTSTKWVIAGVPLILFRRLAVWTVKWIFTVDPSRRFHAKVNVWGKLAEIEECYRESRANSAPSEKHPGII
jgi:glycosyltransferase involved in cell wall biosynthesis